jgi:hypothetical protein
VTSTAATGSVVINSATALEIDGQVSAVMDVELTAEDGVPNTAGDDLTVNAGSTIQSIAGKIVLNAGDDLFIAGGSQPAIISAASTVTIHVDAAATDDDFAIGSTVQIDGLINSGSGATVNGGNDSDTFRISRIGAGGLRLNGGGEADNYFINLGDTAGATLDSPITIDDSGAFGTDQATVIGGANADNLLVSPTRLSRNNSDVVIYGSSLEMLTVRGEDGEDRFDVTPSRNTVYYIDGGSPSAPATPGDTLNFFTPPGQTAAILADRISANGFHDVFYTEIETHAEGHTNPCDTLPLIPLGTDTWRFDLDAIEIHPALTSDIGSTLPATLTNNEADGATIDEFLLSDNPGSAPLAVRRFDFNASGNDTAAGFIGVRGSEIFTTTRGYGWAAVAGEFQRGGPSPLRRDGHYGSISSPNTFQIVVDPAKQYNVRVYVGDASFTRNQIQVTVEGAAPYTIASLPSGTFDSRTTLAAAEASQDGIITVTIRDLGGDYYWVINGVDIWEVGVADPLAHHDLIAEWDNTDRLLSAELLETLSAARADQA